MIFTKLSDSLIGNAGFFILIIFLIIIAVSIQKFSKSIFTDLKKRPGSKGLSPSLSFVLEKSIKFGMYTVIIMIGIFAILSAMGLGDLGQSIILMMSVIIGFVVSMAATGAIGNALSGMVIYAFKPIEKGDRVSLSVATGEIIEGDVITIDLMFTTLEDLNSQELKVPNNVVLANRIVNHTKSEHNGIAIEIDVTIGYDVPGKKVKQLMRRSAMQTTGVMKEPKAFVQLTEFHNHAIEYKLRAFIKNSKALYSIKSDILLNMQKNFYQEGIEILSPVYEVGRRDEIPDKKTVQDRYFESIKEEDGNAIVEEEGATAAFTGLATLEVIDQVDEEIVKRHSKKKKQ